MEMFERNKRSVTSITIFQEFIKELGCLMTSKELMVSMIDSYERAKAEDTRLDVALARVERIVVNDII